MKSLFQIQRKVIALLRKSGKQPLYVLAEDKCSEISRSVGKWIVAKLPKAKTHILKGTKVCGTKKSHDILVMENNGKFTLIDPTVWQFFRNKRSILIGEAPDIKEGLELAKEIYGGKWTVSKR